MFEKVNPHHPDKVADRIAGAIVDLAYTNATGGFLKSNPRIAVEVLIGHYMATVIIETSLSRSELSVDAVNNVLTRLCPDIAERNSYIRIVAQDGHLSKNQQNGLRVGDNGIFRGCPVNDEQRKMTDIAKNLTEKYQSDGKYILDGSDIIICQSRMEKDDAVQYAGELTKVCLDPLINPLGEWTGGSSVDCGATNRKLGSDMGDAVTGGGLHGKDLSKADVSVNIVCHIKAQASGQVVVACTAIGDTEVTFRYADGRTEQEPFADVVEKARLYILSQHGSFEHFAEWGLIC